MASTSVERRSTNIEERERSSPQLTRGKNHSHEQDASQASGCHHNRQPGRQDPHIREARDPLLRDFRYPSMTAEAINALLSQVMIDQGEVSKKELQVDRFLNEDAPNNEEKLEIARDRKRAREEMDEAIKKREENVNPKLVEILKKHYGVDFDTAGKGKVKLGATTKTKADYDADAERFSQWALDRELRNEELAEEYEQEMKEKCPFAPSITNKSRQIYSSEKENILKKREERQRQLQEKRELRQKAEQAKLRNTGKLEKENKDAFSRKLPKKDPKADPEKKQEPPKEEEEQDEEKTIKRDKTKDELESFRGETVPEKSRRGEKKITSHQADTFHKHMMEWCDRKEKNKTQKTVEHWINNFDEPESSQQSLTSKSAKPQRSKVGLAQQESQVAHANALIGSLKRKEQDLEVQRQQQTKGLFRPKVTHYIPNSIIRTFRQERDKSVSDNLNVVYYARSGKKGSVLGERSASRDRDQNNHLNFVQVDEATKALPSRLKDNSSPERNGLSPAPRRL